MSDIDDNEVIIRRIPPGKPGQDTVMPDGSRVTSATLMLKAGEQGLSCSRLSITSPEQLLSQIGKSISDGWSVCGWKVAELPADLHVVITPSNPPERKRPSWTCRFCGSAERIFLDWR